MHAQRVKGEFNFVNADLIASGLSPFAPERELMTASKLFLNQIHRYVAKRESFAFETTLSGKTHARLISKLRADNWRVELIYLWIASVTVSLDRVRERVEHGGHNIPPEAIIRRYPKSVHNLLYVYSDLCTTTLCLDNSREEPDLIFTQDDLGRNVTNAELFEKSYSARRTIMTELEQFAESTRATLKEAVTMALDKKRRLGQYAVIYQDGKSVRLVADQPVLAEWRIEEPTLSEIDKADAVSLQKLP